MSPEQADGLKADGRTDIYSLGVTFYRALTGEPPFSSPTVMNLLFKHKFEAPPDPRTLRSNISESASNLILTMMAKRREDRPETADDLVALIEKAWASRLRTERSRTFTRGEGVLWHAVRPSWDDPTFCSR